MESGWWAPVLASRRANRLGFVVDVVSYGQRDEQEQKRVETRLLALLRTVVADVGDDFDEVDRDSGAGDSTVVLLATGDDPTDRLPVLLRSVARRLAEDNAACGDRIRLRMAVGTGPVAAGGHGFAGPLVVNISRLVDSEPLRRAVAENPAADLAVLVLDPGQREVAPGYAPLVPDRVELVDVAMKQFVEQASLWVSSPQRR
jgi:hypothetical protein